MFYSNYILAKKGPLGKVWLAAHLDKRLPKSQILQADVTDSVEAIVKPQVPMALRLCGHLLLGVVRIYDRKVKYLLGDCSDALVKIKMAFRPGVVDLPVASSMANFNAITLPETALDIDTLLLPEDAEDGTDLAFSTHDSMMNVSRIQDITMDESMASLPQLGFVEENGDLGAPTEDLLAFDDGSTLGDIEVNRSADASALNLEPEIPRAADDGFGDDFGAAFDGDLPPLDDGPVDQGLDGDALAAAGDVTLPSAGDLSLQQSSFMTPSLSGKKRRRADLPVDRATEISADRMRLQLTDTSDIVIDAPSVPLDKRSRLLHDLRQRNVEQLLRQPLVEGLAPELVEMFESNMKRARARALAADTSLVDEHADQGLDITDHGAMDPSFMDDGMGPEFNDDLPPLDDMPQVEDDGRGNFSFASAEGSILEDGEDEVNEILASGNTGDGPAVGTTDGVSVHTARMHDFLQEKMQRKSTVVYEDLVKGKNRKTVAGCFLELLVLKTSGYIDVKQGAPYGKISISKAEKFGQAIQVQALASA